MAWVTFTAAFDWTPPENRRVTIAYPADSTHNVTRACAAAAKAKGVAKAAKRPRTRAEAAAAPTVRTPSVARGATPPPKGEDL